MKIFRSNILRSEFNFINCKASNAIRFTIIVFIIIVSSGGYAQKQNTSNYNLGCGVESSLSFNGHGSFLGGFIRLNKSVHSFDLGIAIQKRFTQVNGVKLSYSCLLGKRDKYFVMADEMVPVEGPVRLNAVSFIQYVHKGSLSYNRSKEEMIRNPESNTDWNATKLSTVEAGMGFEIVLKISKRFNMRNYIGLSAYYHLDYIRGMYQERMAPTLFFGSGFVIPEF